MRRARIPIEQLDRESVLRDEPGSLHRFVRMCFANVEPTSYVDNWHIKILCDYLEQVSRNEISRLVINVPPGTMKSLTVSVFWPLWEWIKHPQTKFMFASYDATLAARDGRRTMHVMQSKWFQKRFDPRLTELRPAATDFDNTDGGFRFATSVAGKATGRHADIQVVDDPIKPHDVRGSLAVTKKAIGAVSTWWRETMASRRANAATFRRVIVMQRLHEDDLAGEMLSEGGWTHLCLPMRAEPSQLCPCRDPECTPEDPRRVEGELLWPERFPESVVREDETTGMGPSVAAAQNQQRPTPASGGIFGKDWFRYWHNVAGKSTPVDDKFVCRDEECRVLPDGGVWIQSWDMTFKGTDGTDFVAGGVWLYKAPDAYLVAQVCARMSFVEACRAVVAMSNRYPLAFTKLIEDKANGPAIVDVLKKKIGGLVLVDPRGGKEARAHACSGLFEAGNVFLPHDEIAPWVPAYRTQVATFPRGVNDDMVDQTTQALIRLQQKHVPLVEAMRAVQGQLA
jgi:predicted phage terminase large subunit-like protein